MVMKKLNEVVLVDLDVLADRLQGYYPKISHKQAGHILQDAKFSTMTFENDTGLDVADLSQEEFFQLSDKKSLKPMEPWSKCFSALWQKLNCLMNKKTDPRRQAESQSKR